MSKKEKSKRIRTFSNEETEEILDAEEEFANENALASDETATELGSESNSDSNSFNRVPLRQVRNFAGFAGSAMNEATKDAYSDKENEEENGRSYESNLTGVNNVANNASGRVQNMIRNMRRNDLTRSEKDRERERLAQDKNITDVNPDAHEVVSPERKTNIADNKTLAEIGEERKKAEDKKEFLDNAFHKPKKKKSLLDRLTEEKNKRKAKEAAKKAAIKEKGPFNAFVEKITGTSVKTIMGFVLKIVLFIALFVLIFALIVAIIFYFSNNYTREASNEMDAKRLDTRVARAIYAFREEGTIKDLYNEYFNTSSGDQLAIFKKNYSRLVPSNDVEKLRAGEDPSEAFILQDPSNWFLLYLERLSYAWGGYLDWEPEYIDDGTIFANCTMREPNVNGVSVWRDIAEKVGAEYGIDPNILLSIVDIESSGDPHATNGVHWGLGQIGEDFTSYFDEGEEYKSWTPDMRVPVDNGSCDLSDPEHIKVATMQFTYIARRLSHQMAIFLKQVKNTSLEGASNLDKKIAIGYVVTGYNQGEARVRALYDVYGDELFLDDGTKYANKFLAHVNNRLPSGYQMIGESQANYLKLFNKFYSVYAGSNIDNASIDPSKWYKVKDIKGANLESKVGVYPGPVTEAVKLVKGSIETDTINQIRETFYKEKLEYIVNQYNRWMTKFNNYYLTYYGDKFIKNNNGELIPELYAKDIHGMDILDTVIKYASYIHEIVSEIKTYTTEKTYSGSLEGSYAALKNDLMNEVNDITRVIISEEPTEALNNLENKVGINRYEMSFEAIRTVDSNNNLLENDEAIDLLENSLAYSVPIYEYATTNLDRAYKSFFDYEIYNKNNYNDDYTLKISDFNFRTKITGINTINISMKSFVNNGWSDAGQRSIEDRMEKAFEYLYINDLKAYNSSNHYAEIPENLTNYYFVKNNNIYDRMIEKVHVTEHYHYGECNDEENYEVKWEASSGYDGSFVFDNLETKVIRDYYLSNIKPSKYTSLKYEANFDYITEETGDRNIETKDGLTTCYEGKVYKIIKDIKGNDTGEREYVRSIYRKEVSRYNTYAKEKVRNMTILTRGIN